MRKDLIKSIMWGCVSLVLYACCGAAFFALTYALADSTGPVYKEESVCTVMSGLVNYEDCRCYGDCDDSYCPSWNVMLFYNESGNAILLNRTIFVHTEKTFEKALDVCAVYQKGITYQCYYAEINNISVSWDADNEDAVLSYSVVISMDIVFGGLFVCITVGSLICFIRGWKNYFLRGAAEKREEEQTLL